MRASRLAASLGLLLWVTSLGGCLMPGALAVEDRLPQEGAVSVAGSWREALSEDVVGCFEAIEIRGDAATSVVRVRFCFDAGGGYTAEATLVFRDGPGQRKISGTWKLVAGRLHLGRGSEPAEIQVDGNVSFERAPTMVAQGGTCLVAGTSSVFHRDLTIAEGIQRLRAAVQ